MTDAITVSKDGRIEANINRLSVRIKVTGLTAFRIRCRIAAAFLWLGSKVSGIPIDVDLTA